MCMNEVSDVERLNESDMRTDFDGNPNIPPIRGVAYQMD
jgi:hypothetical protein